MHLHGRGNNRYQLKNKAKNVTNVSRVRCEIKRICESHNVLPSLITDCPHCQEILDKLKSRGDKGFIHDKLKPFIHNYTKLFCNEQILQGVLEKGSFAKKGLVSKKNKEKAHDEVQCKNRNTSKIKQKIGRMKDSFWNVGDNDTNDTGCSEYHDKRYETEDNSSMKHDRVKKKRQPFSEVESDCQSDDSQETISKQDTSYASPKATRRKPSTVKKIWSKSKERMKSSKEQKKKTRKDGKQKQLVNVTVCHQSVKKDHVKKEKPELVRLSSLTEGDTNTSDYMNSLSTDQKFETDEEFVNENNEVIKSHEEHINLSAAKPKDEEEKIQKRENKMREKVENTKMDDRNNKNPTITRSILKNQGPSRPDHLGNDTSESPMYNKNSSAYFLHKKVENCMTPGQHLTNRIMDGIQTYQQRYSFGPTGNVANHHRPYMNEQETSGLSEVGRFHNLSNHLPNMKSIINSTNTFNPRPYQASTSFPQYCFSSETKNFPEKSYFLNEYTYKTDTQQSLFGDQGNTSKEGYPYRRDQRGILEKSFQPTKGQYSKFNINSNTGSIHLQNNFKNKLKSTEMLKNNYSRQDSAVLGKQPFETNTQLNSFNCTISRLDGNFVNSFKDGISFTTDSLMVKNPGNKRHVVARNLPRVEKYNKTLQSEPSSFKLKSSKFKGDFKPYDIESRRLSKVNIDLTLKTEFPSIEKKNTDINNILKKYLGNEYTMERNQCNQPSNVYQSQHFMNEGPNEKKRSKSTHNKFLSFKTIKNLVNSKSKSYFGKPDGDKQKIILEPTNFSQNPKMYPREMSKGRGGLKDKNRKLEDTKFNEKCQKLKDLIDENRNYERRDHSPQKKKSFFMNPPNTMEKNKGIKISILDRDSNKSQKQITCKEKRKDKTESKFISFSKNRKVLENLKRRETKSQIPNTQSTCRGFQPSQPKLKTHSPNQLKTRTKNYTQDSKMWKKYELNNNTKVELFKVEHVPKPLEPLVSKIIHPGNISEPVMGDYYGD